MLKRVTEKEIVCVEIGTDWVSDREREREIESEGKQSGNDRHRSKGKKEWNK